jgi:hypothetical protein
LNSCQVLSSSVFSLLSSLFSLLSSLLNLPLLIFFFNLPLSVFFLTYTKININISIKIKMSAPPAIWLLGHPSVVSLNERDMIAAAAQIAARQLRSGLVRPLPL